MSFHHKKITLVIPQACFDFHQEQRATAPKASARTLIYVPACAHMLREHLRLWRELKLWWPEINKDSLRGSSAEMCNAVEVTVCWLWLAVAMETSIWVRGNPPQWRGQQLSLLGLAWSNSFTPYVGGSTGVSFARLRKQRRKWCEYLIMAFFHDGQELNGH